MRSIDESGLIEIVRDGIQRLTARTQQHVVVAAVIVSGSGNRGEVSIADEVLKQRTEVCVVGVQIADRDADDIEFGCIDMLSEPLFVLASTTNVPLANPLMILFLLGKLLE